MGDAYNRQLQLFSLQADGGLQQEQSLQLESKEGEAGLCNAIVVQPDADLVVLANIDRKAVYVLHVLRSGGASFDYLTKYQLGWPILSMEAEGELSNGVARLFCVQTHAIQAYNLQLTDCIPQQTESAAPKRLTESFAAEAQPEVSSAAPVSSDVMPSHMLADSEEEDGISRPQSAGSTAPAPASSPDQDVALPRPPPARDDASCSGGATAAAADAKAAEAAGGQPRGLAGLLGQRGGRRCPGWAARQQRAALWAAASAHAPSQAAEPSAVWRSCNLRREVIRQRGSGTAGQQPPHVWGHHCRRRACGVPST